MLFRVAAFLPLMYYTERCSPTVTPRVYDICTYLHIPAISKKNHCQSVKQFDEFVHGLLNTPSATYNLQLNSQDTKMPKRHSINQLIIFPSQFPNLPVSILVRALNSVVDRPGNEFNRNGYKPRAEVGFFFILFIHQALLM